MKAIVILNEQHGLMDDQKRVLNERFDSFEVLSVPACGWTLDEIEIKSEEIVAVVNDGFYNYDPVAIVFASPVPAMIKFVSIMVEENVDDYVFVFHNDNREKKELPNGKVVMTVAQEGWQLV